MPIELTDVYTVSVGDIEMGAIDYTRWLDGTELLTGTPTVVEPTTSGLTIGNVAVSTAALTIKGSSVSTGKAIQFSVQGQTTGNSPYVLRVTASTDATVARTVVRDIRLKVV